jgi:hypothetical protein
VPKKVERVLTNGLSQTEVKSRLKALADTIDSHGWAVKNVSSNAYALPQANTSSDRLIDISNMPDEVPGEDLTNEDILDENSNPIAQQFELMIDKSSREHRQELIERLNDVRQDEAAKQGRGQSDDWFAERGQAPGRAPAAATNAPAADSTSDEDELSAQIAAKANSQQVSFNNLRTMQPLTGRAPQSSSPLNGSSAPDDAQASGSGQPQAVTPLSDPAIISLAKNNDFNVATLAREAQKTRGGDDRSQDEVVVSLH